MPHNETDEVVEDPEHNEEPECFQILDRIRATKKNSTGSRAFLLKVLCGPASFIASEFIILFVGIAHIIIGIVFFDSCTIQSKIPVWLIVNGISNIALSLALGATSTDNYVNRKKPSRGTQTNSDYNLGFWLLRCLVYLGKLLGVQCL